MATIGLMLGKRPRPASVMGRLVARLEHLGDAVLVHAAGNVPAWIDDADLVAVRGLSDELLRDLVANERAGVRFVDPPSAVLATRDRALLHDRLRALGVATPDHEPAPTWPDVERVVARRGVPAVVKHRSGEVGRGTRVHHVDPGAVPAHPPFPGPYVIEDAVPDIRTELKLYRVGSTMAAFELGAVDQPVAMDPAMERIATRTCDAVGLAIVGIDVLVGRDGPVVVDVNPFPSCRRLPDPAGVLARHLQGAAGLQPSRTRPFVGSTRAGRRS